MKVYAPGKLILSGEHAVVYGGPALAMAVNRYAIATVTRELLPHISFHLADLAYRSRMSIGGLQNIKERIKRKYHRFMRGEYSIKQVLHKPFELAQVALGLIVESFNMSLPHGVKIHLQSDIPIGCGMGSSAATILCVMHAVSAYLKVPLSEELMYQLALEAENMQHGQSSGIDLRVAMQGGCLFVQGADIQTRRIPQLTMYIVNTGTPLSTTGQCVEQAAIHFRDNKLIDDFSAVTIAMDAALQQLSLTNIQACIRENHQLLMTIGVVPNKVQQFITDLELIDGAAKICGAGAVAGDNAGVLLVMVEDNRQLKILCEQYGYQSLLIYGESRGVHVV